MIEEKASSPRQLFRRFTNKYTFVGLLFLVWIAFIDRNSLVEKGKLHQKITTLTREKEYYETKFKTDSCRKVELLSSRDNLEKFAREQYLMKNADEDIFIIIDK